MNHTACTTVPAVSAPAAAQPWGRAFVTELSLPPGPGLIDPRQVVGVDLAQACFQVHACPGADPCPQSRALSRSQFRRLLERLAQGTVVVMEACGSCHYWARECAHLGLRVKIIDARHTARRTHGRKDDRADAKAIWESALNPGVAAIRVKSVQEQAQLAAVGVRERLLRQRTAACHHLRALLYEQGLTCRGGVAAVLAAAAQRCTQLQEEASPAAAAALAAISALRGELTDLQRRLQPLQAVLEEQARGDERCRRLMTIPGIGAVTAVAITAHAGDIRRFATPRQLACFFGLTPGHTGTGGRVRITHLPRGIIPVRRGLHLGAIRLMALQERRLRDEAAAALSEEEAAAWMDRFARRRPAARHLACVIAHKLMRMAWAVLRRGEDYDPRRDRIPALVRRCHLDAPLPLTEHAAPRLRPAAAL